MQKRILIPLDGSGISENALRKVIQLFREEDFQIFALRVLELPEKSPQFEALALEEAKAEERREVNRYLDSLKELYEEQGVHLETRVRSRGDDVATAILAEAEIEAVDLIALTTHGRTGLKRLVFGSVADKLIKSAPCTVMVVR